MTLVPRSQSPLLNRRTVVVGAAGFIGGASARALRMRGHLVVGVTRADVDLGAADAGAALARLLEPGDCVVIAAAVAPVKDTTMLIANLRIQEAINAALRSAAPSLVIYVSSDAVYRDSPGPLDEDSCAEPGSLHGAMHVTREVMLRNDVPDALCLVRPTLVYGSGDPHNGYGPNRFLRSAKEGGPIALFGRGEERRDHVHVDDVAELIARVVESDALGVINAATGEGHTFHEVAEQVVGLAPRPVSIEYLPRIGAMPHGGLRLFDAGQTRLAFPDFHYTGLADGLVRTWNDEGAHSDG